jgi:prolyl-tRNA editing enzyme YbaK/EbsC (Cys-tRNA(Pro) deacylase)
MALPPSAQRVQDELRRLGSQAVVVQFEQTTRSAAEAAAAVGCDVGAIAKSLVFRGQTTGDAILVITSGANRVDEGMLARTVQEGIGRAEADFVRRATGFSIGGVPPLGHPAPLRSYFDEDLLLFPTIWAAAGLPNAVFEVDPHELLRMTAARVLRVKA